MMRDPYLYPNTEVLKNKFNVIDNENLNTNYPFEDPVCNLFKEVIPMATVSFTKDFAITKRETVERLEKGILTAKPLVIDSNKVLTEKKGSEERLLELLRSKA